MKEVYLLSRIPVEDSDKFFESVDIFGTREAIMSVSAACSMCDINIHVDSNYPAVNSLVKFAYDNYKSQDQKSSVQEFTEWPENIESGDIMVVIAGTEDIYYWTTAVKDKMGDSVIIYPIHNTGGAAKELYKTFDCPEIEDSRAYTYLFRNFLENLPSENPE